MALLQIPAHRCSGEWNEIHLNQRLLSLNTLTQKAHLRCTPSQLHLQGAGEFRFYFHLLQPGKKRSSDRFPLKYQEEIEKDTWLWLKIKQEGLRGLWSMFPLTRVPFWYRFFEPQPHIHFSKW